MAMVFSTFIMLFMLFAISASATKLRGQKHLLLRHAHGAMAKVLDHGGAVLRKARRKARETTPVPKSELILREGLGENLPYPGSDYIGVGYDIVKGNPSGSGKDLLDPGFRAPVIQLEWSQAEEHNTRDLARLVPKQGWGLPMVSCQHASTASKVSDMTEYTDSLQEDASTSTEASVGAKGLGVGVSAGAAFSGSEGSKNFRSDVVSKDKEQFDMKSYCVQYKVGLNKPSKSLNILPYFTERVETLPTLEYITTGDCEKHYCTNLYLQQKKKYIDAKSSNAHALKLVATAPADRLWLFNSDDLLVYLVTRDGEWKMNDAHVLTRKNGKPTIEPKTESMEHQQWLYHVEPNYHLAAVDDAKTGLTVGRDGKFVIEELGDGHGMISQNFYGSDKEMPWHQFFGEFGTHFVNHLELGGRMTTTVTMTKADAETITETGLSASDAVALSMSAEGYGLKASGKNKDKTRSEEKTKALNQLAKTNTETHTLVLGGDPPEDTSEESMHGFGEWAKTVALKPMPVRYELTPLLYTKPFQCEENVCKKRRDTLQVMFWKHMNNALAAFDAENYAVETAGKVEHTTELSKGNYMCPTQILSPDEKFTFKFACTGELTLTNNMGGIIWESGNKCTNPEGHFLHLQEDGNMVVYCQDGAGTGWKTGTYIGTPDQNLGQKGCGTNRVANPTQVLKALNTGNVELYYDGKVSWKTNTAKGVSNANSKGKVVCTKTNAASANAGSAGGKRGKGKGKGKDKESTKTQKKNANKNKNKRGDGAAAATLSKPTYVATYFGKNSCPKPLVLVNTKGDCEKAAAMKKLKVADTRNFDYFPKGCTVYNPKLDDVTDGHLSFYFNTHKTGNKYKSASPVCTQAASIHV